MPLLDIDKAIKTEEIRSRFRLVSLASQRARSLNSPEEGSLPPQSGTYTKVTTNALDEIIERKVEFVDEEQGKED